MESIFLKSGLILKNGTGPNQLTQDQALFQKQITDQLQFNPNTEKQIAEDLVTYVEDKNNFFFTLFTTETPGVTNARCNIQDSLVHLLLGIPQLQPLITDILFEKLAELSGFDESFAWKGTNYSLIYLIVRQFKFISNVVSSKDLCDKILEILDAVTEETQKNIIEIFPEILNDEYHPKVAKTLSGYLTKCSSLTLNIIETLECLNIPPDLLAEINDSAAMSTAWMKCEYLPVIIRFLYVTCHDNNMENVTRTVRDNLAGSGFNKQMQYLENWDQNHIIIILDRLKLFIQIRKSVGDAWIKVIESNACVDTQIVDFFVTLILFSISSRQQTIKNVLRHKIQSAHFSHRLVRAIFKDFSWALKDYFDSIIRMAEWSLKHTSDKVIQFGHYLYKYSFQAFDTVYRQEVIQYLLSHFSSYKCSEVDSAISVLMDLIKDKANNVSLFAVHIKRVIDHFDQLNFHQLRLVYECLSMLACSGTQEGDNMQNDLQLIIQKQVTNKELKYKRFGIVGGLSFIANLASTKVSNEDVERAERLLEYVLECVKSEKLAMALVYDELSYLITKRKLNSKIEEWIYQNVIISFQDNFIIDVDSAKYENFSYDLDKDQVNGAIAIDLITLVAKELKNDKKCISPLLLSPQFRLFRIYESIHSNGSLEAIDALLGCALHLFPMNQLEEFPTLSLSDKDMICHVLFHCINWFRELVNGFVTQSDKESKNKVLTRLKNIVHFEDVLKKCLTYHSKFIPPSAQFDTEKKSIPLKRKRETSSRDKPKQKANTDILNSNTSLVNTNQNLTPKEEGKRVTKKAKAKAKVPKEKETPLISLSMYQQYFRKLDFDVFNLLSIKCDYERNESSLTFTELIFLLEDLKSKLETSLRPRMRRAFGGGGGGGGEESQTSLSSSDVFRQSVNLISHLCVHLESTYGYFQDNFSGSQELIDAPRNDLSVSIAQLFHLLLQCVSIIFNWNDTDSKEFEQCREKAVVSISGRLSSSGGGSQLSIDDHVTRALDYVIKFGRYLPTFSCAAGVLSLATSLSKINQTQSHHTKIGNLAVEFLKQPWFDRDGNNERGLQYNLNVQQIITVALQMNLDPITLIQDIVTVGFSELLETGDECKTYRTLNKFTFATYYRVLFLSLVKEMKQISTKSEQGPTILRWRLCVEIFQILVNAVKVYKSQTCIITCLKCSRSFVENFLKLGFSVLDTGFKRHKDDILGLLKTFQMGTRFLQHLCCHAKIAKQLATMKHIPQLRKNLEAFLYRVKAMLALHNCQDAFWLGNLKNKDIQGEEIPADNDEMEQDVEETEQADETPSEVPEELQGSENSEDEEDNISVYNQSF